VGEVHGEAFGTQATLQRLRQPDLVLHDKNAHAPSLPRLT
jgi:hypothetical protein